MAGMTGAKREFIIHVSMPAYNRTKITVGGNVVSQKISVSIADELFQMITEIPNCQSSRADSEPAKSKLKQLVWEKDGVYVKKAKEETEPISNFLLRPVAKIQGADANSMELQIVLQSGEVFNRTFNMDILTSLQRFIKELANVDPKIQFRGTLKDLHEIRSLVGQKVSVTRKVVTYAGIHRGQDGRPVFVTCRNAVTQSGLVNNEFVLNPDKKDLQTMLNPKNTIQDDDLKELLYPLINFNSLPITVTILSYIVVCFLQEVFRLKGVKIGCLIMTGEGGSGKSTTVENIIQPIFGMSQAISASHLTDASLRDEIASCNTIPLIVEEFKVSKLTKEQNNIICNMLRSSYDGHMAISQKGGSNQTIEFRRPLIVAGESAPDESAIRERAMKVVFSKLALQDNPDFKTNLQYLKQNQEKLSKLGNTLIGEAMDYYQRPEYVLETRNKFLEGQKKLRGSINNWPDRAQQNFANANIGLAVLLNCFRKKVEDYEQAIQHNRHELLDALYESFHEYLLEGRDRNMSVVDTALQTMFLRMKLKAGKDFKYLRNQSSSSGNPEVALDLDRVYALYIKQAKKQGFEVLDQNQFVAQLKTKEYYVGQRPVRMNNENQRKVILDVRKLETAIDGTLPGQKNSVSQDAE